jgi:hypothetical protein
MTISKFFDKGFYINLDRRLDRKKLFEKEMKLYGLQNFFERVSADDSINETDCMRKHFYCASTYYKLFERVYSEGYEKVLIFEDDAYFHNEKGKKGIDFVHKSLEELTMFPTWEMIYFGGHPIEEVDIVSDTLMKSPNVLTLHAVGYKRSAIKKILDYYTPFVDAPLDGWLGKRNDIEKYITYPIAISQRNTPSDLDCYGNTPGIEIFKQSYDLVKKNYLVNEKKPNNTNK